MFFDFLDDETKEKFTKTIAEDLIKMKKEWKIYNIEENIEIYTQINEIHGLIYDYYNFGTLVDVKTGETFTLSTGINMIEDLLKDVTDELYLAYEKDRIEKILQMFERRLKGIDKEE